MFFATSILSSGGEKLSQRWASMYALLTQRIQFVNTDEIKCSRVNTEIILKIHNIFTCKRATVHDEIDSGLWSSTRVRKNWGENHFGLFKRVWNCPWEKLLSISISFIRNWYKLSIHITKQNFFSKHLSKSYKKRNSLLNQ